MLAVGPLGPQYCWLFAWYELGRQAHLVFSTKIAFLLQLRPYHTIPPPLFHQNAYVILNLTSNKELWRHSVCVSYFFISLFVCTPPLSSLLVCSYVHPPYDKFVRSFACTSPYICSFEYLHLYKYSASLSIYFTSCIAYGREGVVVWLNVDNNRVTLQANSDTNSFHKQQKMYNLQIQND